MRRNLTKTEKKLAYTVASMTGVFLALIMCAVIVATDAFCWFSKNTQVSATGMSVQATADMVKVELKTTSGNTETWVELKADQPIPMAGLLRCPGDYVDLTFRVTLLESSFKKISRFGFVLPTAAEDQPIVINNTQYRLASQLECALVENNQPGPFVKMTDPSGNPLEVDVLGGKTLTFTPDASGADMIAEVTVRIAFVNTDVNQDNYKDFGTTSAKGCFKRRVFLELSN